ncbi:MAG: PEP-CTERM sorting domain-containing protein [Candidatus Auribacter fodinae]|uniref:PEP-CTERM sorting domain-containing protein n=1 Tax=Candidatus Auribacter fodinae TaxID=2093366 RepID=A0A3A4RBB9_9BACT|nr:MAG: PEP-CTERM sorting domain-containing protein [Candidatus Auribacter fodinae]
MRRLIDNCNCRALTCSTMIITIDEAASAVPEPATIILIGSGIIALLRRKAGR